MAKLRKEPTTQKMEKEKNPVVAGKITKSKNNEQITQARKRQVILNTPARAIDQHKTLQTRSTLATPFSNNSVLKFTSTPMTVEHKRPNGILSLKGKLPSRSPLSPIIVNAGNIRRAEANIGQKSKDEDKGNKDSKKNLPKKDLKVPKATDENAEPKFRTRRPSVGVRKMARVPESAESHITKVNKEVPHSRLRGRKGKPDNSLTANVSSTETSLQNNEVHKSSVRQSKLSSKREISQTNAKIKKKLVKSTKTYVFSDSSDSDSSDSLSSWSEKNDDLIKRLQYRENKCSKLRVRSSRYANDPSFSIDENTKRRKPSSLENSVVKRLKSDWSSTTFEETPTQNRTPKDHQIQRNQVTKRRLTPLVEMSSTEEGPLPDDSLKDTPKVTAGREDLNTPKVAAGKESLNNENDYSSSAEFQSDDEENQSRSKRAPTWKDLLNKTNESAVIGKNAAPENKVRCNVRRSRRLASKGSSDSSSTSGTDVKKSNKQDKNSKIMRSRRLVSRENSGSSSTSGTDVEKSNKQDKNSEIRKSRRLASRENSGSSSTSGTDVEKLHKQDEKSKVRRSKRSSDSSSRSETDDEKTHKTKDKNTNVRRSRRLASRRSSASNSSSSSEKDVERSKKKDKNKKECDEMPAKDKPNKEDVQHAKRAKLDLETEVPKSMTSNKSHDTGKEVHTNAQDIEVCEDIPPTSPTQQKESEHPNCMVNTISSPNHGENETVDLTTSKHPPKFFHSRIENNNSISKPEETLKRRRSSKKKKQEAIYDFLSQSSSDTKNNNPADDVIQKMIKNGKVVVAKHKKGSGKSVLPRGKGKGKGKPKKIIPQKVTPKIVEETVKPTQPLADRRLQPLQEQPIDYDDDFHFDDGGGNEFPEEEDHVRDQRGFSNLARSAMIKQAGRIQKTPRRKSITDKKVLLEMARKYVSQSTPVRMTPQPMVAPQFSPMSGNKSPWRVDDDRLPNPFYLGRNSDNLPSYSSDHIPMTPTKNKSKSMSSFSSNDSNGENVAPPGAKTVTNESSMQSLANNRKALNYRSPLKAINILDVVPLHPLALHSYGNENNNSKDNSKKSTGDGSPHKNATNLFDSVQDYNSNKSKNDVSNKNTTKLNHTSVHKSYSNKSRCDHSNVNTANQLESIRNDSSGKSGTDASNDNATDLFGFEELIDDDENDFTDVTVDKTILPNKDHLKERLQRLKNLRPDKPVIISDKTIRMKPVFDDVMPKQRTLKQMLCSTMIDNQGHSDLAGNDVEKHSFNETGDLSQLFKDPEPETTFDDSRPRRTYNRQFKKKRKLRNNFVMFMDSDLSEEDEEEEEKRKEEPVKKYKAKQKKRQKKADPELKKFVNEFNEMCKEVSQYELIVE